MKHELSPLFSLDSCMKLVFLMLLFGMLTGCGKGHGGGQVAGDENHPPLASALSVQTTESTTASNYPGRQGNDLFSRLPP